MFSQRATVHVLAECWNKVETALDDWRETNSSDFPVKNIEQLHVFAVTQHAKMVRREIFDGYQYRCILPSVQRKKPDKPGDKKGQNDTLYGHFY